MISTHEPFDDCEESKFVLTFSTFEISKTQSHSVELELVLLHFMDNIIMMKELITIRLSDEYDVFSFLHRR